MVDVALTIAGSDPSGGAGIQADLKTFHQHQVYGAAVITLLTVQNTRGVDRVEVMGADLVGEQIDAVVEDVPPAAVKTGALGSAAVVEAVAQRALRLPCPLVVDPVMIGSHGTPLLAEPARELLVQRLLPTATLVTPNAPEAAVLAGREVTNVAQAREAARAIAELGPRGVLVTGGHLSGDPVDVLLWDGQIAELAADRVETDHTHGTGCAYSAAITAWLARGVDVREAVERAKEWLAAALEGAPGLGGGTGPIDLFAPVDLEPWIGDDDEGL